MKLNWPQDLDESRFLAEYWQQKPLLLRNAFENFDNPLDPNELAGLACEEDSNARYIEHTGNNEWRLCAGPLSEDFFDDVSGNEWSLLVSDVEKLRRKATPGVSTVFAAVSLSARLAYRRSDD